MASSVATGRSKRATAGNRMAKLINGEEPEKDEFYETAYGGFKETEGDGEYKEEHEVEDDTIDSDFDAAEDEASKVEQNGDAKPVKRTSEANGSNATEEPAAKVRKEETDEEKSGDVEAPKVDPVVVDESTTIKVEATTVQEAETETIVKVEVGENQAEATSPPKDGENEVAITEKKEVVAEVAPLKTEENVKVEAALPATEEEVVAEVPKEDVVAVVDAAAKIEGGDSTETSTKDAVESVEETVPAVTTEVDKEAAEPAAVEVQQTE